LLAEAVSEPAGFRRFPSLLCVITGFMSAYREFLMTANNTPFDRCRRGPGVGKAMLVGGQEAEHGSVVPTAVLMRGFYASRSPMTYCALWPRSPTASADTSRTVTEEKRVHRKVGYSRHEHTLGGVG